MSESGTPPSTAETPKKRKRKQSGIRTLRAYFGFERDQFAELLNVHASTIRDWENGRKHPRPEGWRRLRTTFIGLAVKEGMTKKKAVAWVADRLLPTRDAEA